MKKMYFKLLNDVKGIESAEVAVLIVAIILVAFAAYKLLGNKIAEVVMTVVGGM